MWPYRGDYDFNDAVIDYNFNQITNGNNALVELNATFILRAHGAYFHNGFGIELPIQSADIESVEGTNLSNDYISLNANGTEAGHSKAVVIMWDDSYDVLSPTYNGIAPIPILRCLFRFLTHECHHQIAESCPNEPNWSATLQSIYYC